MHCSAVCAKHLPTLFKPDTLLKLLCSQLACSIPLGVYGNVDVPVTLFYITLLQKAHMLTW